MATSAGSRILFGCSGKDIIEENPIKAFEFSKFRYINFLATQGPLQITLPHHWQAIYENDVDIIVMLTNTNKSTGGKNKKGENFQGTKHQLT